MRRSRLALLVFAAVTAIACATPNETPLPGETQPSPSRTTQSPTSAPTSGSDQTAAACRDAVRESNSKVALLKAEIAKAADPSQLFTALAEAERLGQEWVDNLKKQRDRNISASLKNVLNRGIGLLEDLVAKIRNRDMTLMQESVQQEIVKQIEDFLADLDKVCN